MAASGMHGWADRARRDMETDGVEMSRRGDRAAVVDEYALPILGIAWFKVTYQLSDPGGAPGGQRRRWSA